MQYRNLWVLALVLIITGGALLARWTLRSAPPVPVGLLAAIDSGSAIGSSEVHAYQLFREEQEHIGLRLLPLDNQWNTERAALIIASAMNQGIHLFISSNPSKVELAGAHMFKSGRALLISTASTTPELTGKDDYLLRIIPDAVKEQRALAQEVAQWPGHRLLVIQDTGNRAYTDAAFVAFAIELARLSTWQIERHQLVIAEFKPAELQVLFSGDYDALYILAGSAQPVIGNIAQLFNLQHQQDPILLTPWSRSPAIAETAGDAVSHLVLPSVYAAHDEDTAIADYYRRFTARFGYPPLSTAVQIRQALELLDQAFSAGQRSPQAVKECLLSKPLHHTSLGNVSFDRYGDVSGNYYFIRDVRREFQ